MEHMQAVGSCAAHAGLIDRGEEELRNSLNEDTKKREEMYGPFQNEDMRSVCAEYSIAMRVKDA